MNSVIQFPASAVRTIPSPSQKGVTTYFAYVNFKDLPDLSSYLEVNPRKPKMTTNVAKQLIAAVESPDTDFDINNRGIVIVARTFKFNTNNSTIELDLANDPENYGILDGGHTYTAITEYRYALPTDLNKFVRLEIIVGEDLTVSRISDARNTSAQVSDIALYELDDKFDFIKNIIKNEPYANDVAYKDNDKKRLPVVELLKLLYAYNIYKYPDGNSAPIQAYSSKAMVFKDIKDDLDNNDGKNYQKLANLLPELVKLYDTIELELKNKYKEINEKGRFGALRGVEATGEDKTYRTYYLEKNSEYKIANGFILPIFGAFRALINPNTLDWEANPNEIWELVGGALLKNTLDAKNPQDAGKKANIWTNNYQIVKSKFQEIQNAKLLEKLKELEAKE